MWRQQARIFAKTLAGFFFAALVVLGQQPLIQVAAGESIQRALDRAPVTGAEIVIAPGTYREVLEVLKPRITLRGSGSDPRKTVIVFDRSASTAGGTTRSATVNVRADDFLAKSVSFANDWNRTHEQKQQGSQALALLVTGDRAVFRNIRLLGNQDTVYAANPSARQYFDHCYIEGNVDFIFGDSRAYFDQCEIHSTAHKNGGSVTAHGRSNELQQGAYVFDRCRFTAQPGQRNVFLGRPWRPYARVIFLDCEMGGHIEAAGWREWHPGETHSLDTAYYAEYRSSGPGGKPDDRDPHSHQLTASGALQYSAEEFFKGWIVR